MERVVPNALSEAASGYKQVSIAPPEAAAPWLPANHTNSREPVSAQILGPTEHTDDAEPIS